jgi:hypothetical protein
MGPTALLPLRRKWCSGFLSPLKIHRSGSNPRTLGPVASTLTTSPPRSTIKVDDHLFSWAGYLEDEGNPVVSKNKKWTDAGKARRKERENIIIDSKTVATMQKNLLLSIVQRYRHIKHRSKHQQ